MKSEYDESKGKILWCLSKKNGIKLEEPNNNLSNVYIKKAKSALNMLSSAAEKEELDWMATTAYYARYFVFYALLQKCGITSEIHECTISLMQFLFVEENIIHENMFSEFQLAKTLRVDTQYYFAKDLDANKLKYDADKARDFVLKIEEIIENITPEDIKKLRNKIVNVSHSIK